MTRKKDAFHLAVEWISEIPSNKGFYLNEILNFVNLDPLPSHKARMNKLLLEGIRLGYLTRVKQKAIGNPYLYSRVRVFDVEVLMDAYREVGKESTARHEKKRTLQEKKRERRSSFAGLREWIKLQHECLREMEAELDRVEARVKSFFEGEEE